MRQSVSDRNKLSNGGLRPRKRSIQRPIKYRLSNTLLAITYGWKTKTWCLLTEPGNYTPYIMDLFASLSRFPPSLTNWNSPPHGPYTMSSMHRFYDHIRKRSKKARITQGHPQTLFTANPNTK